MALSCFFQFRHIPKRASPSPRPPVSDGVLTSSGCQVGQLLNQDFFSVVIYGALHLPYENTVFKRFLVNTQMLLCKSGPCFSLQWGTHWLCRWHGHHIWQTLVKVPAYSETRAIIKPVFKNSEYWSPFQGLYCLSGGRLPSLLFLPPFSP